MWSTPNVTEMYTPAVRSGGLLRLGGARIDGGNTGDEHVTLQLHRTGAEQKIRCRTRNEDRDAVAFRSALHYWLLL
jgi:hypothetical protein